MRYSPQSTRLSSNALIDDGNKDLMNFMTAEDFVVSPFDFFVARLCCSSSSAFSLSECVEIVWASNSAVSSPVGSGLLLIIRDGFGRRSCCNIVILNFDSIDFCQSTLGGRKHFLFFRQSLVVCLSHKNAWRSGYMKY